ncbi:MAG: serine protease [Thermoanaerobaculales bacterium]|jgi:hypothetical protein|nr:serine protease [Thermoanaerobaculales bacterium]
MKWVQLVVMTTAVGAAWVAAATTAEKVEGTSPAIEIVGEDIFETYASPNPYPGVTVDDGAQLIWSDVIHWPGASYICPHFGRMDLGPGDAVVVRSPDGARSWRYENAGVDGLGLDPEGFWGIHISGDTAVIELWSAGPAGGFGYVVDRYARGFTRDEMMGGSSPEAIIGVDDSVWAPCYETSDPVVYDQSRAVARLLINGSGLCTGWLVGAEGHMLTNEHCITAQSQASNTNYEFMAEGADCATNCWQLQCPGTIVTTSGTLIADSSDYDYALVQLSVNPAPTYGFFTLRATGGVIGERLYIPQHPQGWGKRIALYSTDPSDPGHPVVVSKSYGGCSGRPGPDMGYRADTQGGSSGSPVVAHGDNQIIALHHCGSTSMNTAVLIEQVIAGLGSNLPPSAFGVPGLIFDDDFETGGTGAWSQTSP